MQPNPLSRRGNRYDLIVFDEMADMMNGDVVACEVTAEGGVRNGAE